MTKTEIEMLPLISSKPMGGTNLDREVHMGQSCILRLSLTHVTVAWSHQLWWFTDLVLFGLIILEQRGCCYQFS